MLSTSDSTSTTFYTEAAVKPVQRHPVRRPAATCIYNSPKTRDMKCYSCRRRRLKCDGRQPKCLRCENDRVECLGYSKPLKWVKGVAARGRLMGKNFDGVDVSTAYSEGSTLREVASSGTIGSRKMAMIPLDVPSPMRALVDPIFQDLDSECRFYISFYEKHFCQLLVLHDSPSENLYRRMIPLSRSSPLLLTTIISVGACFYTRSSQFASLSRLDLPDWTAALMEVTTEDDVPASKAYLVHKQSTLSQLSRAVADPKLIHDDGVVASILLLIFLDLLESGNGSWRLHLEGAANVIKHRLSAIPPQQRIMPVPDSESSSSTVFIDSTETSSVVRSPPSSLCLQDMKSFLTGSCMSLHIMGNTFSKLSPFGTSAVPELSSHSTLQCFEANSYIGCPAYLLMKMSEMASFRSSSSASMVTQAPHLEQILADVAAFNVDAWATSIGSTISWVSTLQLFHLGFAYKLSILFYGAQILRLISPASTLLVLADASPHAVDQLIAHLTYLRESPELSKGIIWTCVVAGAEARTDAQREYILEYLRGLYELLLSAHVLGAVRLLQKIWQIGSELWIEQVEEGTGGWLFV